MTTEANEEGSFNVALSVAMNGGYNGANGRALHPAVVEMLAELRRPGSVFTFQDEEEVSMTSGAFFVDPDQTGVGGWSPVTGTRVAGQMSRLPTGTSVSRSGNIRAAPAWGRTVRSGMNWIALI